MGCTALSKVVTADKLPAVYVLRAKATRYRVLKIG